MGKPDPRHARIDPELREHVTVIEAALEEHGALDRAELWDVVDCGSWKAGEFGRALSEAAVAGVVEPREDGKFALTKPEHALPRELIPFVSGIHRIPTALR
jgi:hypothetical protein